MNSQQMMEEIARLARLCEAKDAEIAFLQNCQHTSRITLRDVQVEFNKQLSEAQAQVSMQHAALKVAKQIVATMVYQSGVDSDIPVTCATLDEALSATSETVAEWRAKETEPLRREVSMLRDVLADALHELRYYSAPLSVQEKFCNTLSKSQATALAYEREVKAKALEGAAEYFSQQDWRQYATGKFVEDELMNMAAELRASKGE